MPENLSANNHEASVGGSCEGALMSQAVLPDTARRTAPAWLAWAGLGVVYVVWGSTYLAFRMDWKQLGSGLLIGLLLPAWGNGMVVIAEQHVASGLAALLIASVPLYVVLLRRVLGERPPAITLLGVSIGMAGLAVL